MPVKEAAQVAWADNFNTIVGSSAETYGISAPMMAQFNTLNTTLQTTWAASSATSTRTRGTVANKNNALLAMKTAAKKLVSIIQGSQGVTDQMLIDAGLTVRKTKPTPAPVPSQKPFIKVTNVDGRTVTIELRQDATNRAKPAQTASATIFTATGDAAPMSMDGWSYLTVTGKTTVQIPFAPSTTGDTVWITAFWTSTNKQSGPAAKPVSVNLPAGGVMAIEAEDEFKLKAAA